MGEKLALFSEQTQFVLSSSADNLTPSTANVLVQTEFESNAAAACRFWFFYLFLN